MINNKRESQIELAKHLQQCFKQMAVKEDEQAKQEKKGSRDRAWCQGAMIAFAMAENACKLFITGVEAEEAGYGVLEWTPTGFELNTNKKEEI